LMTEINRAANGSAATTVVMVTHERSLAERYARRMVTIGDGRVAGDESR